MTQARITRLSDWRTNLLTWLASTARSPFVYGAHDCALFTLGGVAAMTGHDLAAPFRGRYGTLAGGIRILRKAGYRDHVALVAASFDEIAPIFAQVGDIAVIDSVDGPALGLVQGEFIYALSRERLDLLPLLDARRAFRVP
jgi:hypothetical protein